MCLQDDAAQSPEHPSAGTAESNAAAQHSRQAGLGAQAIQGECAFCGSGNEAEPLGWVVSNLHSVMVFLRQCVCTGAAASAAAVALVSQQTPQLNSEAMLGPAYLSLCFFSAAAVHLLLSWGPIMMTTLQHFSVCRCPF